MDPNVLKLLQDNAAGLKKASTLSTLRSNQSVSYKADTLHKTFLPHQFYALDAKNNGANLAALTCFAGLAGYCQMPPSAIYDAAMSLIVAEAPASAQAAQDLSTHWTAQLAKWGVTLDNRQNQFTAISAGMAGPIDLWKMTTAEVEAQFMALCDPGGACATKHASSAFKDLLATIRQGEQPEMGADTPVVSLRKNWEAAVKRFGSVGYDGKAGTAPLNSRGLKLLLAGLVLHCGIKGSESVKKRLVPTQLPIALKPDVLAGAFGESRKSVATTLAMVFGLKKGQHLGTDEDQSGYFDRFVLIRTVWAKLTLPGTIHSALQATGLSLEKLIENTLIDTSEDAWVRYLTFSLSVGDEDSSLTACEAEGHDLDSKYSVRSMIPGWILPFLRIFAESFLVDLGTTENRFLVCLMALIGAMMKDQAGALAQISGYRPFMSISEEERALIIVMARRLYRTVRKFDPSSGKFALAAALKTEYNQELLRQRAAAPLTAGAQQYAAVAQMGGGFSQFSGFGQAAGLNSGSSGLTRSAGAFPTHTLVYTPPPSTSAAPPNVGGFSKFS